MAVTMKTVLEKEAIKNKSSPSPACWGEVELESASLLTVRKRAGRPPPTTAKSFFRVPEPWDTSL